MKTIIFAVLVTLLIVTNSYSQAGFGYSTGNAGDVNGDGKQDLIVGAPFYSNLESLEGAAYLYYGTDSGFTTSAVWMAESNQEGARLGYSVSGVGDVNGDGFDDVGIGAIWFQEGQRTEGGAFIYFGSATGLGVNGNLQNADIKLQSNIIDAQFGYSVASAGDVNNDGFSDVIIGSPASNRAYLYLGSTTGITFYRMFTSTQTGANFGICVGTAGDVNKDGFDDIIIGSNRFDNQPGNYLDEGTAFVYYGSSSGVSVNYSWKMPSFQRWFSYFGASAISTGDVNGDGYSDIAIGGYAVSTTIRENGAVLVYMGGPTGLSTISKWEFRGNQSDEHVGKALAVTDFNQDGFSDLIMGIPESDDGQVNEGILKIAFGSPTGLSKFATMTFQNDFSYSYFAYSIAGIQNKIAAGSPWYSINGTALAYTHGNYSTSIILLH